jgi:hypothetical protein
MSLHVKLSRFSNNTLVAFGSALYNAVKNILGIDAVLLPFATLLEKCKDAVNNVLEKTKAKEVSQHLKSEDNIRDNCLVGINKLVDAQLYNPDATIQNAAAELNVLLEKLGDAVQTESYDKESILIKTLLTDFTGDYSEQVTTVHANPFVDELGAAQSRFDTYRQQQLAENVEMTEIVAMSTIRREFESSIRSLLSVLPTLYQINPTPELKEAIALVQETINKF